MKKTFSRIGLAAALASALSGCVTSRYSEDTLQRIPKNARAHFEQSIPEASQAQLSFSSQNALDYPNTLQFTKKYGAIPTQHINLYLATRDQEGRISSEKRDLDTTGPLNNYADEVSAIQQQIPEGMHARTFILGTPSYGSLVSSRSAENQLSKADGLLGIVTYSDSTRDFAVQVRQKTSVNRKLRRNEEYDIIVAFNQQKFSAKKSRTDFLCPFETAENAALAFGISGPGAAAGVGIAHAINYVWALIEGKSSAEGAYRTSGESFVGALENNVARTSAVLEQAKNLGATDLIVFNYGANQGTGIIFAQNASNVSFGANMVQYTTDYMGASQIISSLHRFLGTGAVIGGSTFDQSGKTSTRSVTGGRREGPGGR